MELRRHKNENEKKKNDELYQDLASKDSIGFWKQWKKINHVNVAPVMRIDGSTVEKDIAHSFSQYFQGIYCDSDSAASVKLKDEFNARITGYIGDHVNESIRPYYLSWSEMMVVLSGLKLGKASAGSIRPEHIMNGSHGLYVHLHLLFNGLIQHGFVPTDFLKSTISPVIKDREGDLSTPNNYRGVTLSNLFAQLFERALRLKFGHYLGSDDLQFGFKSQHSTSQAMYCLKSCVEYFTEKKSNVFAAFFDFTKVFDKISHHGLFLKLMNRNVPLCFLFLIIFWYMNMSYNCKWGKARSGSFDVFCGTKQGGVLSPDFFSLYINDLIIELRKAGIGCHIIALFTACILFADDMALLAPTRGTLQELLDICADYCETFCLTFNAKKTKVLVFGDICKQKLNLCPLKVGSTCIEYASQIRYLGFHLESGRHLTFNAEPDLKSFYRAANSILNVLKKPMEEIQMKLLFTNCVSIITYGSDVKVYNSKEMINGTVAINDAIRKIFSYNRWESVRTLRQAFNYDSLSEIFHKSSKRFLHSIKMSRNHVLLFLSSFTVHCD